MIKEGIAPSSANRNRRSTGSAESGSSSCRLVHDGPVGQTPPDSTNRQQMVPPASPPPPPPPSAPAGVTRWRLSAWRCRVRRARRARRWSSA